MKSSLLAVSLSVVAVVIGGLVLSGCQAYYPSPEELEANRDLDEIDNTESFNFRQGLGREADAVGE